MLSPDQLSLIIAGLELLTDPPTLSATGRRLRSNCHRTASDLLRATQAELQYQQLAAPLIAEHDRILASPTLSHADETRLGEINRELADLSIDRPTEFGGRFSADDAVAMGIIRAAAQAIDSP
jgi:hypothetical protein